jgi:DNA-binding NtrC family response regulator
MSGLMIAEQDRDCRSMMAELLQDEGYSVTVTDSAADALNGILKKSAQVVLLGSEFDDLAAADLIPLLKQCNRDLTIILVSDELSQPAIRKIRAEGIFYHALKPAKPEDTDEIRQAVQCAFSTLATNAH